MDNLKHYIRENYEADDIQDIALRGCVNGFSGVTYYSETTDLYNKFHKDIWDMLWDISEEQGITQMKLISNLIGQDNVGSDAQFKNHLVWNAFEYICSIIVSEDTLLKDFKEYEKKVNIK